MLYRIGAVRVGQYSGWQSLQNGRAQASTFAANQSLRAAFSNNLYGAQLTKNSGIANLVVQTALARLQGAQSSQNTRLQQAGSTLNQSTSSSSSPGSILNTVA